MVARLAISTNNRNGQYVGTTKSAPPTAGAGSLSARLFNGTSDRLVGPRSLDLGLTFVAVLTFWRSDSSILANDLTAGRLFTQYAVGSSRVALGLNRSFLSLTTTSVEGIVTTTESVVKVLDVNRHTAVLVVNSTNVIVYLDGREAIRVDVVLAAPDTARVVYGADGASRFFKGWIDDASLHQNQPNYIENWARYYRALLTGTNPRDYVATPFAPGFNLVALTQQNYMATGSLATPISRVAMATAFRTEPELNLQFLEFRILNGANNAQVKFGIVNSNHDLAQADIGTTANSYAYTQDGRLVFNNANLVTGIGAWTSANIMAIGWKADTRTLSLWKDGLQIHSINVADGTWYGAVALGSNSVHVNSGQAPMLGLPQDTPGVYALAYSRMNTEFREMKLGEVVAPLDDPDFVMRNARTALQVGTYEGLRVLDASITPDSLDRSSGVSDKIKVPFADYTTAGLTFFFAVAFKPTANDLIGEKVILESPGAWGIKMIDGRINAWVGSVQVGSVDVAFEAGGSYLIGMTRASSGKLLVWCHIGYMLQSGDATTAQTSGDVYVGSKSDGTRALEGRLSHLVLSTKLPDSWKMERFRHCYNWTIPLVAGLVPNPATVRKVFEPSYRDVLATGISGAPSAAAAYAAAVAVAPDVLAVEFREVAKVGADAYQGEYIKTWTSTGILQTAMAKSTNVVTVTDFPDLSHVALGEAVLIDDEICRIDAINRSTGVMTLARGCVDTIPARHSAGARVWFYEDTLASNRIAYAAGQSVDVKLLSRNALTEMPEEFAPVDTVIMAGRIARPYPPAGVTVNDIQEPTGTLTGTVQVKWKHRNKTTLAASLVAWNEAGPTSAPASVLYVVRLFSRDSAELIHESTTLGPDISSYDLYAEFKGDVQVTVTSYQGGQVCWQTPAIEFNYDSEVIGIMATEYGEAVGMEDDVEGLVFTEDLTTLRAGSYSGDLPDGDYTGGGEDDDDEEEEEEVVGEGAIEGVKISEFGEILNGQLVGDEQFPMAKGNSNYRASLAALLQYVVAGLPPAQDGESAYEIAVANGYVGSEAQWLASLRGPAGPNSNASRRILTISSAAGPVICDWALYDEIRLRLTGNVVLSFTGAKDGQGCMLKFQQDGVGGRTVTMPANLRYNNLILAYVPSMTPNAMDKVGLMYDSADSSYDFVSLVPGITS